MTKYATTILISNTNRVLAILKNRPAWQAGSLNFPGGKVEPNETFEQCALRELKEETDITVSNIEPCAELSGPDYHMMVYYAVVDDETINKAKAMTDEPVIVTTVDAFLEEDTNTVAYTKQLLEATVNDRDSLPLKIEN